MGTAVTAEPKAKKSKPDVSAGHSDTGRAIHHQSSANGAPAGTPLFLGLGIQRKLAVGAVDDPLEREADRIAESVVAGSTLQRKCACGGSASGDCDECRKREQEVPSTGPIQRRANGNGHSHPSAEAPPIVHDALRSSGEPLDASVRTLMEGSFGRDFGDVRVHTDPLAADSAQAVQANAYTAGQHIVFDAGRYAPESVSGRRLLAHELTHVLQQNSQVPGPIRRDFNSDFAGRTQTRVADQAVHPPGTIRMNNVAGDAVWAPFGIYTPQEVPAEYQDRIMESGKAYQWRNPQLPLLQAMQQEEQRGANVGELTVGDMTRLAQGRGSQMNIRVMMAHIDNDYRFVGYDMSLAGGGVVGQGFVESEPGTAGVGRALFADRVVRALQSGSSTMNLEVYISSRTERFHQEICRTAGVGIEPTEGTHYSLNTRQMVRIVLSWSDALSDAQRVQLVPLATGESDPTPAQAQGILQPTPPGSGPPASTGGFTAGNLDDMRRFGESVNRNLRQPLEIKRMEELHDAETAEKIMNEHAGFASLGGRLYRVQREAEGTRISEVTTSLVWQRVGAAPAPAAPAPAEPGQRPVGLDPARVVKVGGEELERPAEPTLKAGEVVIVNAQQTFEARDAQTGRPLIGIFEGGEWYRIVGVDGRNQTVESLTAEGVRPVEIGGRTVLAEPFEPEPIATPGGAGGGGGVAGGVVAAGGIIMVLNEILGPMGAALQNQRARIRAGEAEIDFWTALGANPRHAMWDVWGQAPAPPGTKTDTSVMGTWYYPYVSEIDAYALRTQLPLRVHNYYELQLLLYSAVGFGAIQMEKDRWFAVVNRPARGNWRVYDITDSITTIQGRTLDAADAGLRNRLAARPESERSGRIFRIAPGSNLYRSRGGTFNSQILFGAGQFLGSNALVREVRRTNYWISTDMVFVEPVNADAYQAVAFTQYRINQNIEDAWKEAKRGGREVIPTELPSFGDGPLENFRAGPETTGDRRFGWINYTRDPEFPGSWTVARGELLAFWVSAKSLQGVDESTALPH